MKHSIILDDEASAKLQQLANEQRRSFNNFVQGILYQWLNHYENHQPQQRSKEQGE